MLFFWSFSRKVALAFRETFTNILVPCKSGSGTLNTGLWAFRDRSKPYHFYLSTMEILSGDELVSELESAYAYGYNINMKMLGPGVHRYRVWCSTSAKDTWACLTSYDPDESSWTPSVMLKDLTLRDRGGIMFEITVRDRNWKVVHQFLVVPTVFCETAWRMVGEPLNPQVIDWTIKRNGEIVPLDGEPPVPWKRSLLI